MTDIQLLGTRGKTKRASFYTRPFIKAFRFYNPNSQRQFIAMIKLENRPGQVTISELRTVLNGLTIQPGKVGIDYPEPTDYDYYYFRYAQKRVYPDYPVERFD
jgi:hypothetical protein